MNFHTVILSSGKTATGIVIPPEVVAGLGPSKKPPVRVTIKGYTYRSTVATVSGNFMVGVSEEVRKNAGVAGGDEVDVEIALDTEPREVTLPPDFKRALDRDKAAKKFFEGLSYSNKRRLVVAIEAAKAAETRQRRIAKTVSLLHEGKS